MVELGGKVVEAACGLDVITAVSSVQTVMAMERSATGEDVPAAILELIALLLTCRDAAGPAEPCRDQYGPDNLYAATRELLSVGSMIPIVEKPDGSPESTIVFASIQREVLLRNPVYPHMLLESLHGLFGDEAVDADCREVLGFGGHEAVEVMNAASVLLRRGHEGLFERMFAARDALLPYLRRYAPGSGEELPEEGRRALQENVDAMTSMTTNIADTTTLDPDAIARETGLSRATVERCSTHSPCTASQTRPRYSTASSTGTIHYGPLEESRGPSALGSRSRYLRALAPPHNTDVGGTELRPRHRSRFRGSCLADRWEHSHDCDLHEGHLARDRGSTGSAHGRTAPPGPRDRRRFDYPRWLVVVSYT
ncbi:hypothetical protein [Amycolatopsis sp. YIM 10]|uniref:hypothetical protein n=1 Tax=Amycolatopsis sp. YIM 10 TaxID=2653857 RepID=UPI00129062F3|nr:hypothetical protein [Amycolatopsis sp. YIM 10]